MVVRRRVGTLFSYLTMVVLTTQVEAQGMLPGSETPGSGTIYGRTTMETSPIQGVQVSAYRVTAVHGQSSLIKQCMTWTDDRGSYTCSFLPGGDYLIALEGYGRRRAVGTRLLPSALLFPATMDVDRATLVSVHRQEQQEASFELARSTAAFKVSGVLLDGYREGTLGLYAESARGFSYRLPITPKITKDGKFSFSGVPPGLYDLRGRELIESNEYNSSVPVQVRAQDISDIDVVFYPQDRSELVARLPDGVDLSLISITMVEMASGHRAEVDSSNAPRYAVSEITPGSYWISIADQDVGDLCIDALQVGGRFTALPLNIERGVPIGKISVNTTTQCFTIHGSIETHRAGVVVVTDKSLRVIRMEHTDPKGNFSIGGLSRGGYHVFGWGSVNGVPYRSLDLLAKHLKDSIEVEVHDGDRGNPISLPAISN